MSERSDEEKALDRIMDFNKHLTTLSAGSLVLIGTFMKDIFPKDLDYFGQATIGSAIVVLIYSMSYSLLAMRTTTAQAGSQERENVRETSNMGVFSFLVGIGGFVLIVLLTQVVTF